MNNDALLKKTEKVKEWLFLYGSGLPYIFGFCLSQWTSKTRRRYPDRVLMDILGAHISDGGSNGVFFATMNSYIENGKKLFSGIERTKQLFEEYKRDEKAFMQFSDKVDENGGMYLHNHFSKFIELYDHAYVSGVVMDGILVYGENFLNEMCKKYPDNKKEIEMLAKMPDISFYQKYHREMLRIALRFYKDTKKYSNYKALIKDKHIYGALIDIQARFHWMQNNYKDAQPLGIDYFAEELFHLFKEGENKIKKESQAIESYVKNHEKECKKIKDKQIFSDEDYEKIVVFGMITLWGDMRKAMNLMADYYIVKHLEWISKKYGYNYDDLVMLFPWEVDEVISGKRNINDFNVEERLKSFIVTYDSDNNFIVLSGKECEDLWSKIYPKKDLSSVKEIKGYSAFKGKIKGKARVIFDPKKSEGFEEGDILVSGMTRPDFISLMKKAGAIITDEGGITCHAAIVARELKKPCIIGTKIATKVLHDNDEVEVDADKGVVRKI